MVLTAASCDDPLTKIHPGPVRFRVSIGKNLAESNGLSTNPSISGDGRYVVFASDAKNLALPSSTFREIFLRDRVTDTVKNITRLANVPPLEQPKLGDCDFPFISRNGNWVVFLSRGEMTQSGFSWPPAILPPGAQIPFSVIRWDRVNDIFDLVVYWPDSDITNATISDDGNFIAFVTSATNMPGGGSNQQIYVADASLGFGLTLISKSTGSGSPGNPCNGFCADPTVSADGTSIVFSSQATDLTADVVSAGRDRIFVGAPDGSTMEIVSKDDVGAFADNHCVKPNISGDGRYVSFVYGGGTLVTGISPSVAQVVRRDRTLGTVVNAGIDPVAAPFFSTILAFGTAISDDGQFVAAWYPIFDGTGSLVDLDVKVQEIGGKLFNASLGIIGNTGATLNDFPIMALSADGRWVVFPSLNDKQMLGDSNSVIDIFGFGSMR
jgi:hypothetical protein